MFDSVVEVPYARRAKTYYKKRVAERMAELRENDRTVYEVFSEIKNELGKTWHPGYSVAETDLISSGGESVTLEEYVDNHITLLLFMFKALFLPLYVAAQISYFGVDEKVSAEA